jgi:pSer/pThr/pTyr-binding forkhead associated (FHA) protein
LVTQQAFILIIDDGKGRREIPLGDAVYSIDRDPTCDIHLFSEFSSRIHATLVRRYHEDGSFSYLIVDGNLKGKRSDHGLLINGQKLQSHNLENEDEIVFSPGVSAKYYRPTHL